MARRFRFPLETVRKLRQLRRDGQRRVVAEKARAVGSSQAQITELDRRLGGVLTGSRSAQQQRRLDIVSLRGHQFYRAWLDRKITEAAKDHARKRDALEAARTRLAKAETKLKVIEKLRERQWKRYLHEIAREEQALNDEAALQMHERRIRRDRRPPSGRRGLTVVA